MHKHKDGKGFTPNSVKLRSTSGLHSHGDGYTLAPNEDGHTHLNKDSKARTSGPIDPATKGSKDAKPDAPRADKKEKEVKKEVVKKVSKKAGKKASKKRSGKK